MKKCSFHIAFPSQYRVEGTLIWKVALHSLTEGFQMRSWLSRHQVKEKQQILPEDSDPFSETGTVAEMLCSVSYSFRGDGNY